MAQKLQESYIEGLMNEWWRNSKSIKILITGKTGTGKSSLINAIFGKDFAKVGKKLDPETTEVTSFENTIDGIKVIIWDSPGLQDGSNQEENNIETCCKEKIDLFIYCVSMQETRFMKGSRDIESMIKLTDKLGKGIWDNAVFVITCANKYISITKSTFPIDDSNAIEKTKKAFDERFKMWKTAVKRCLHEKLELPAKTIERLPIILAGRRGSPLLFDGSSDAPWLSTLWMESLLATKPDAQPALVKMNLERLKCASDIRNEEEFMDLLKKEFIIIQDKASDVGKLIRAEEAGRHIGTLSGIKASIAHLVERMFGRGPFTILNTTVSIDEDTGEIAVRMVRALYSNH